MGPVVLAKIRAATTAPGRCYLRPASEIAEALRLAYGPVPDLATERWCRGLGKVGELLARGQTAHARIYAVLLGFPEIAPEGMAKLAAAAALQKYNPDWEAESRVPPKNPGAGEWATDGSDIEIAARGDLPCQACPSGGSYGTTGMCRIEGKILCHDCALKAVGAESEPASEKMQTLRPYLIGPHN